MSSYPVAWLLPLALWLALLPFTPGVDLTVSAFFFDPLTGQFSTHGFWQFLFDWGPTPALWLAVAAAALWLASYGVASLARWRRILLMVALPLALGSGLVVHGLLKEHWGRPRPRQISAFGGTQPYHAVWQLGCPPPPLRCKSFACGHCASGFYFFCWGMLGQRLRRQGLAYAGYGLALALGILLSAARIAQGGHFFSDTLFSALVMWYAALLCDWLLMRRYSDATADG